MIYPIVFKQYSYFRLLEEGGSPLPVGCCAAYFGRYGFFGLANGTIQVFDADLQNVQFDIKAYKNTVLYVHPLKGGSGFVTLGLDEQSPTNICVLKSWDISQCKLNPGSAKPVREWKLAIVSSNNLSSATSSASLSGLPGLSSLDPTAVAVHELPNGAIIVALGSDQGSVSLYYGDPLHHRNQTTLECISCRASRDEEQHAITFIAFDAVQLSSSNQICLYVVSQSSIRSYKMAGDGRGISANATILDDFGCAANCATVNDEGQLIVVTPTSGGQVQQGGGSQRGGQKYEDGSTYDVHYYNSETHTSMYVRPERMKYITAIGEYLLTEVQEAGSGMTKLKIFDFKSKVEAACLSIDSIQHVLFDKYLSSSSRKITIVQGVGADTLVIQEKPLLEKLDLLVNQGAYDMAIRVGDLGNADSETKAAIHQRYGDALFVQADYDGAIQQYVLTIGHLEPSYVIRNFLDSQRVGNLMCYLERLHELQYASADHTTLLLNCYTKQKDTDKLTEFVEKLGNFFDLRQNLEHVDTAVKVLRGAGYLDHAIDVAKKAQQHQIVLDILLDDTYEGACVSPYQEGMTYLLANLNREDRALALQKHGKQLIQNLETNQVLVPIMELCKQGDAGKGDADPKYVSNVTDFAHLFSERPQALKDLCQLVLYDDRQLEPAQSQLLYHTLFQVLLPQQLHDTKDRVAGLDQRRQEAEQLLQQGWPSGEREARYDPEYVLNLCRQNKFNQGLVFIYERQQRPQDVLQVYMDQGEHQSVISTCRRLSPPEDPACDPQLWVKVLQYLASYDDTDSVEPEIQKVLDLVGNILSPMVVLQTLSQNPSLKLEVVKGFMERYLSSANEAIKKDGKEVEDKKRQILEERKKIEKLKTQAIIFQKSRDDQDQSPLQIPTIHFMCGHSFNADKFGDGTPKQCFICKPRHDQVLRIRANMLGQSNRNLQEQFFKELRTAPDGFSIIAQYYGRGILNSQDKQHTQNF